MKHCAVKLLSKFATFAAKLPASLPDRAHIGIDDLRAAEVRKAARTFRPDMSVPQALEALRPFAEAARVIPAKAQEWDFCTSGLKYGDFLDARELTHGIQK